MSSIVAAIGQLTNGAKELESLNSQLKSAINELASLEETLRSSFVGASSNAFHQAFSSDKRQMDLFYTAMLGYVHTLENIARKYMETENKNIEIANTRTYH